MAKKISKKKKKTKKRQLVIPTKSSEEEDVPETPEPEPIIEPTSPEKTIVIPPKVLSAKSSHEKVRTLHINTNVTDIGVNVIMGEGDLSKETTQPPQVSSRHGGGSLVSNFEIDGLMKACEARIVSRMSGILRDTESRILEKVDQNDQNIELRVNSFNYKYVGAVKELTNVQKQRHTLFVMDVKKVREDGNLKLQDLRDDMVREVAVVQNDYATPHKKFDIICDVVTKYVTLCESLIPQITQLSTTDNQQFGEVISMLKDLKESVLKPTTSSIITPEFLSQKFT
ncbi:unnamed protein product [Lactuca saligna]|uniref:Uncharacterized protein n=1 Tax=Lactuca saligna TaxID=75948 RepID=A0AA35Z668_LACSI|nr:unnamed protein product [Lactuca saligna]